jgi:hypothetical protein
MLSILIDDDIELLLLRRYVNFCGITFVNAASGDAACTIEFGVEN